MGSDVKYTTTTTVGGSIYLYATVTNNGIGPADPVEFQIGGLKDHGDVVGCVPDCTSSEFFGTYTLQFSQQLEAKGAYIYTAQFLATKVGVANWTLTIYDSAGDQIYAGTATTVIR